MTRPAYYEHSCGFYHPAGYNGGCDDDSKNFIAEELDERYGPEGWEETYMDDPEPKGEFVVRRKNYDKMMALTPAIDIHDKPIEIGCRVRCFMPVYYDPGNDWFIGMNTTGKCCYVEGKLVNIEETKDGGPYYAVEMEKEVAPIVDRSQNNFSIRNTDSLVRAARGTIKIPVNGTPVKGIKVNEKGVFYRDAEALTWKTFGVVRI